MLSKNLERTIKRELLAKKHIFRVHSCPGLVEETRKELEIIRNSSVLPQKFQTEWVNERGHILVGELALRDAIEVLYRVRTASGIFWQLASRRLTGVAELKRFLGGLRWELYLPEGAALSVSVSSFSSRLYHEGMIKELAGEVFHDKNFAIKEDGTFHVHIESRENKVTINLALHGEPLQHRGFRAGLIHAAPMAEHIAAAATQWARDEYACSPEHVYVPFCGSGTLGFEYVAGVYAMPNIVWGRSYAAEQLVCFPAETGAFLSRKLSEGAERETPSLTLQFLDWQKDPLFVAQQGFEQMKKPFPRAALRAEFLEGDFFTFEPKKAPLTFIPLNPPFGERLALSDVPGFYQRIGRRLVELQENGVPMVGYIFIPSEAAWRSFLTAIKDFKFNTRRLMHGGLDLRLVAFAGKND